MDATKPENEKQERKRTAFTVMNNIRDHCRQPPIKKLLMLVLATYCNEKGLCYPSNRRLAAVTGTSVSTVQRMLRLLNAEGELRVHPVGRGKEALRLIRLNRRYVDPHVTALTTPPCHSSDTLTTIGTAKGEERVASTDIRYSGSKQQQFVPYPRTEEELEAMLTERGIEYNPDYDGNFFASMEASCWTVRGKPVWNWPAMYAARLERTSP